MSNEVYLQLQIGYWAFDGCMSVVLSASCLICQAWLTTTTSLLCQKQCNVLVVPRGLMMLTGWSAAITGYVAIGHASAKKVSWNTYSSSHRTESPVFQISARCTLTETFYHYAKINNQNIIGLACNTLLSPPTTSTVTLKLMRLTEVICVTIA